MTRRRPFDFWMFTTVIILLSIGVIMIFSASAPYSYNTFGDVYYIFKHQLFYAILGIIVMLITMNFNYKFFDRISSLMFVVSLALLVLVLVPKIGIEENGARRWLELGIRFQPSEIAKIALILFFSHRLSINQNNRNSFFKGFLYYIFLTAAVVVLLLLEPHLSCSIIITAISLIVLFCAGTKIRYFLMLVLPILGSFALLINKTDYMLKRITSYLNPWNDIQGTGYNIVQSLYAIGSGGLLGRGLGNSRQKYQYLPYPHNDFIFSVIAEELGFIGTLFIIILYAILIYRGLKVAANAPDLFGSLAAVGITSLIAIQTILNIGVVTGLIPPTGVSLPLISYGGTSLLLTMGELGILLSISRYSNYSRI